MWSNPEDFLGFKVQENPASLAFVPWKHNNNTNIRICYSKLMCCEWDKFYSIRPNVEFSTNDQYISTLKWLAEIIWEGASYRNKCSIVCQDDLTNVLNTSTGRFHRNALLAKFLSKRNIIIRAKKWWILTGSFLSHLREVRRECSKRFSKQG